MTGRARRAAVFLDRDGTINVDTNYVGRPEDVTLIPGVVSAIRRLNDAGIPVVVVTNLSGLARGIFELADYERVRARLEGLLAAGGAHVDATYVCPHHPEIDGPCDCRKPGTLLHRRAAEDLELDLSRSWYVGDKWRDVAPAVALGGTGVLIPAAGTPASDVERARREARVLDSLGAAVDAMIAAMRVDALQPDGRPA